jgi:formiminotetrahydrofolate cyclodeaminase
MGSTAFTGIQAACAIMIVVGANTWAAGGWVAVAMAGAIEASLFRMILNKG